MEFGNSAITNTIIWAQLFEYSNNPNIRGNTDKQALLISEAKVKDLEGKVQQLKEIDVYKVNRSIEEKDLEIGKLKEDLAREQDNICYNNSVVGKLQAVMDFRISKFVLHPI